MYVLPRIDPRGHGRRLIVGALLAIVLFFNTVGTLLAGTTGTINGTVVDAKTGAGLAGVHVSAVAPTAHYASITDAKGFYSFTGVEPDTYTVSFELNGFQPQSSTGVNVFADQSSTVNLSLTKSLVTIGRVTARSQTGAFQPTNTADTYSYGTSQIDTQLGKADQTSETNLLITLPGISRDSSGYPVIRGGRENEEGYQYEGIPYTDAFTNQFVNSLALNGGVQSLQLTPGAGDASSGNSGTGTLNLIAKRGARPAFGQIDVEALVNPYSHHLQAEYGFATPDGRISNYIGFEGTRDGNQIGQWGTPAAQISAGAFYGRSFQSSNDLTDNFFYKFGKNQNQSIQIFYENQQFQFYSNYGGIGTLCFETCDSYALANLSAFNFGTISNAQIQAITGLVPGQTSPTQALNRADATYQPNDTFKVQYSNNIDASTFVTAKFYKVNSVSTFDEPNPGQTYQSYVALQGGQSTGFTLDATKQLNSRNLIKIGGQSAFLHPVFNYLNPEYGELALSGFGSGAFEFLDFLPNDANCPAVDFYGPSGSCGYIYNKYSAGNKPTTPAYLETTGTNRQDYAGYINDTFTASDRLKVDLGFRVDGANYRIPSDAPCNAYNAKGQYLDNPLYGGTNQCLYAHNAFDGAGNPITNIDGQAKNPNVPEPRLAVSFQVDKNDAVRASYGRSVELAPLGDIDTVVSRSYYTSRYGNIPVNPQNAFPVCGVGGGNACTSYGDQLYWENQNEIGGVPIQPVKPETFNNYDFSYSHQFQNNIGVKITPFYRRGYDALALTQTVKVDSKGNPILDVNGNVQFNPSVATNDGNEFTSGIEFLATKDAAYGFSGSFSATYINEFSNVPPLSTSEDFFPTIPPASLQLGNLYRVGFLSPFSAAFALAWKSHSGLKINPVVTYNKGYPIGAGYLTSVFIHNVATNVVNTNVSDPNGSTASQLYVDPQNPGSLLNPNIAAVRGGGLGPSAGSGLSGAQFNTNLGIEMKPPGSHSTFGVLVTNLFNQLYATPPTLSARYQPVATGISGPKSGESSLPNLYPGLGFANYATNRQGNQPYIFNPSNTPTTYRLYYQLGL